MSQFIIGIDIGGTKIEASLLEILSHEAHGYSPVKIKNHYYYFKVLFRERIPTGREFGYEHIMKGVESIGHRAMSRIPDGKRVHAIGIGLPGTVHPQTHQMLNGNTGVFVGHDLQRDFETIFPSKTICLANDANCFALAETVAGAGLIHERSSSKNIQEMLVVGIILGTGCGSGVIYKGEMIEGRVGGTGEAGHTPLVNENGRGCYCGRSGCAELYISGTGIELTYAEQSHGEKKRAFEIFQLATQSDSVAKKVVQQYCGDLARFLANLSNILDPDFFVLGGGVSQAEVIYKGLESSVGGDLFLPVSSPVVYKNQLGDSAGSLGAAFLVFTKILMN